MADIKTAYEVFKELEEEQPAKEYGENFGQISPDSWESQNYSGVKDGKFI
jgi:hypothetical protein